MAPLVEQLKARTVQPIFDDERERLARNEARLAGRRRELEEVQRRKAEGDQRLIEAMREDRASEVMVQWAPERNALVLRASTLRNDVAALEKAVAVRAEAAQLALDLMEVAGLLRGAPKTDQFKRTDAERGHTTIVMLPVLTKVPIERFPKGVKGKNRVGWGIYVRFPDDKWYRGTVQYFHERFQLYLVVFSHGAQHQQHAWCDLEAMALMEEDSVQPGVLLGRPGSLEYSIAVPTVGEIPQIRERVLVRN